MYSIGVDVGGTGIKIGVVDEIGNILYRGNCVTDVTGGFDKIIECSGSSAAVTEAIMLAKNGGTIILVGVSMTPITVPMVVSVMGEITMKGSIAYSEFDFDRIIELINDKKLNVTKYIDKIITLDEVQNAFETLTSGKDGEVKIIIKPNK